MNESHNIVKRVKIAVISVLALALVGLGYVYYQKNHSSSANKSAAVPAGWAEYKNDEYGFKFIYLQDWGEPQVRVSDGDKGKSYTIIFSKNGQSLQQNQGESSLSIRFDSKDYSKKICAVNEPTSCAETRAFTAKNVQERLKNKDGLVEYTDTSYATVSSQGGMNNTKMFALNIDSVVDIKKVNVDALRLNYVLLGAPNNCEDNNFPAESTSGCMKRSHYDEMRRLISSISNL